MFSTPDYVPYWLLIESFEDDDFNQHTINVDFITFELCIKEVIIKVLEDKMIMYRYDQEKCSMTFYSLNYLMGIIESFCESNKKIIDFPYVIEHFYIKMKPYFDWREIFYSQETFEKYEEELEEGELEEELEEESEDELENWYIIYNKDIAFEYLPYRSNMLWSFNSYNDKTDHKIWFNCEKLVTNGNYYLSLLDICVQFVSLNNRSRNIRWNSLKFFFDGSPYNIIIYLERDVSYINLKLDDIITIFREKSVCQFCVNVGKSKVANSPLIYRYDICC